MTTTSKTLGMEIRAWLRLQDMVDFYKAKDMATMMEVLIDEKFNIMRLVESMKESPDLEDK